MDDHRARANSGIIANPDTPNERGIRADIHPVAKDGDIQRPLAHANGRAIAQDAIAAEEGLFMHNKTDAMIKPQPPAHRGSVVEFDAESPNDNERVRGAKWPAHPADAPREPVTGMGQTIESEDPLASQISAIRPPILKDSRAHLASRPMRVSFFMPEKYLPNEARREAWKSGKGLVLEESGKIATVQSWIYQTWQALAQADRDVELTHSLPSEGIVVALNGTLGADYAPPERAFILGVVADGMPHPAADLQIVQNSTPRWILPGARFIPHWPQPNLLPRDPDRGDRFETVCFYGDPRNLARELDDPSFRKRIAALGLEFRCVGTSHWHDYSETDCALAVRSFDRARHIHKPATKLYNAWLAGVPFLGGTDSAYASDGRSGINYLRCASPDDVLSSLQRLREDSALRSSLAQAGREASRGFTPEAITRRWIALLDEADALRRRKVAAPRLSRALSRLVRRVRIGLAR